MQPHLLINQKIWQTYVSSQTDEKLNVEIDPYILQVWSRCRRQHKHDHWSNPHRAKGVTFSSIQKSKAQLLNIAIPSMEDIYEYLENDNCALLISDETGCTLSFLATPTISSALLDLGIEKGMYWREGIIGNNAISSAIHLAKASQTVGFEHYKQALHGFAMYAAPIFDNTGIAYGCVALILPISKASPIALALMHSAACDIASQMHAENMLTESNQHLSEVNILLEGVVEGVLAWHPTGKIHYLNQKGAAFLGLTVSELGSQLNSFLTIPQQLLQAIKQGKELDMVETTIESKGKLITLVVSLKIVKNMQNEVDRYILLLYPLENIRNLVHQHSGNRARLTFDDISSKSDAMCRIVKQAHHAAKGRGPVLLHGEDSLDKSHLAQAIHNASTRQMHPFIAINCQAIPKELMAMEFLGAAFSNNKSSPSKFELAQGGTLFLENVENLSSEVQAALLHLLKTGLLNLINRKILPIDVRIIATSNVNLEQSISEKYFRRQLLLELQTFDIHILPLRDRIEDVVAITERKISHLEAEQKRTLSIHPDALELLLQYRWPGNHSELRNVIERAANFSDSGELCVKDMPDTIFHLTDIASENTKPLPSNNLLNAQKNTIVRSAKQCRGKISQMCLDLQIGRTTLWRKLKAYNIDVTDYK